MDFSTAFHQTSVWMFRLAFVGAAVGIGYIVMTKQDETPATAPASIAAPIDDGVTGCKPIGQTASGKLVYSMDCEQLPSADAAK
ncbi:hypothetical protein [Rhodopseudomonas palustris]|uniref:hypothetical protein n=1 Tax=Rhodopseudomonas TaxID=1073 RepID=UPI000D1BEE5C|nr:hypothetical protein [Rhodopseudomonas palustris]AVT75990.1 hypothetical protein RPPS3_19270 [Rhodopseudomonas palustris]UYO50863.1 hypothetical protein KQX64_10050 [Rhodopseudomonas palustris]UYO55761.1 hypothetical protein KQX61_10295 [Rhodopseudomonas palustris]